MGFGQGLSGLNAAAQNLDVIGNNIANANTVGFKSSSIAFADVYASSRVGLGVKVAAVNQRFTVGNVTATGGEFDIAIDGAKGFFRVTDQGGAVMYTRNGQFYANKDNYIVNAQGYRLTGYPAGGVGQAPVELMLPKTNVPPQATSLATTQTNLNANAPVIHPATIAEVLGTVTLTGNAYTFRRDAMGGIAWAAGLPPDGVHVGVTIAGGVITAGDITAEAGYADFVPGVVGAPFNPTVGTTYTNTIPMTVYDSLGNSHTLTQYFVKREANGAGNSVYEAYYTLDGQPMAPTTGPAPWGGAHTLEFDLSGRLLTAPTLDLTFANPGGAAAPAEPLTVTMDYSGTTQYGSAFSPTITQNGFSSGEYMGVSIANDGSLLAEYSNGEKAIIGTIALANFNNVNGLKPVGNNAWSETSESGQAVLGQPGTNGLATLTGAAVEESNVDMSKELVNMIIAQRTYQANAQTIKTQDEIMQVLMNMR